MGWYCPPSNVPEKLQEELVGLSKGGESEMNAILELITDAVVDAEEGQDPIEYMMAICDGAAEAAKALKAKLAEYKE